MKKTVTQLLTAGLLLAGLGLTSLAAQTSGVDTAFTVQITASQGVLFDNDTYFGTGVDATEGYDTHLDSPEPPAPPASYISAYFERQDFESFLGTKFTKDIRPVVDLTDFTQTWTLSVFTSDEGPVSLSFYLADSLNFPVIVEDVTGLTRTDGGLGNNFTVEYTASAGETRKFLISVGDVTAPVITPGDFFEGPQIFETGVERFLTWEATDGTGVTGQKLFVSYDNGITYDTLSTANESSFTWNIPSEIELNYTTKFKLVARDYVGNTSEVETSSPITLANATQTVVKPIGWNLLGVPFSAVEATIQESFNDNFSNYWVAYSWVTDGGYVMPEVFTSGSGFWLGSLEEATIDVTGSVLTSNAEVGLVQGWQIVSSPLLTVVDMSQIMISRTADDEVSTDVFDLATAIDSGYVTELYGYDGSGYVPVTEITPFNAYWFGVNDVRVNSITLPIHEMILEEEPTEEPIFKGAVRQLIVLNAQDESGIGSQVRIGFDENATSGFDKGLDKLNPPTPPVGTVLSLTGEATLLGNSYTELWFNGNETVSIPVSINGNATVMVSWNGVAVNGSVHLIVNDDVYDLTLDGSAEIKKGANVRIEFTPATTSVSETSGIPVEFTLEQNFPNPFNPETTIRYALPQNGQVSISVFNTLGQEVAVLVNQVKSAGTYTVRFDASALSSGLYFYKMQSGNFVQVNKMVLIK